MALVAVFATSHAFVAVPLQRSHASRSVAPRMLFGGGGKEEGGGNMNMMETIKKAQAMGEKVKRLQEELTQTEIEASAAEEGVVVTISGAQVPLSVEVSDDLVSQGSAAVSEAVTLAMREAHSNSVEYAKEQMTELYADIGLPMPPTGPGGPPA